MKRRNVDLTKLRRPMKSKKISEGVYSSVFGYVKFLAVWGLVLLADFILEFRFEYLYPVWLLIRTVQDSYKYQGVLLTMLFLAVAIGTDIICYVFIPAQWLFFAASSYVWVQYVWHTGTIHLYSSDKGICVSSASLWLLFVYVEAALRMKDHKALPFNMDLCRPFAAHCIGYPVVTLGYGIKTAASESIRRRTRTKVKKSNLFYQQLLREALPLELQETLRLSNEDLNEDLSNTEKPNKKDCKEDSSDSGSESSDMTSSSATVKSDSNTSNTSSVISNTTDKSNSHTVPNNHHNHNKSSDHRNNDKNAFIEDFDTENESRAEQLHRRNINDLSEEAENALNDSKSNKVQNKDPPVSKKVNNKRNKNNAISASSTVQPSSVTQQNGGTHLSNGHTVTANGDATGGKSEYQISRLEADVKRLKADLQSSRNTENDMRSQLNSKSSEDRQRKVTLAQLQQDNEALQTKLHNVVMSRQQDKQNLAALEKKLSEEKKLREKTESQLASERKTKKQEDQVTARAVALASANRNADCIGGCKNRVKELEDDISKVKWDITRKDDQIRQLELDSQNLRKFKESHTDNNEVLMSALAAMQDKTAHLENSLTAESKIKMELFSALGEVKRQMEIQRHMLAAKDTEIAGLRSHITDALALVPSSMYGDQTLVSGQYTTPKLGSPTAGQPYIPPDNSIGGMMFTQPPPTSHTRHSVSSPRFSPVQHQVTETVSPARTPVSESCVSTPVSTASDQQRSNSALNPQAKDYRPGTQPATQ